MVSESGFGGAGLTRVYRYFDITLCTSSLHFPEGDEEAEETEEERRRGEEERRRGGGGEEEREEEERRRANYFHFGLPTVPPGK